jgi:hypothetical protein
VAAQAHAPRATIAVMDLREWLELEIAAVEAQLADNPPMCSLDRQGAAPRGLKELEGRYAALRRARHLLAAGGDLARLTDEVGKVQRMAHAGGKAASPQWAGYARGVTEAVAEIRRHAGEQDEGSDAIGNTSQT